MTKQAKFPQREILMMKQQMKEEQKPALHRKHQTIYLHLLGKKQKEIAEIVGVEYHAIGNYIRQYDQGGMEALQPKKIPAPPRMSEEQKKKLFHVLTTQTPNEVGFPQTANWTADLAIEWVK